ncbi:MAG: hypothetical protein IIU03_05700 [Bacteroidales bacterium]|nr:hypothetical protein [Bacteroidales bacterium]
MRNIFKLLLVISLFSSCMGQRKIASILQTANQLYYEKKYGEAFENYTQVLDYYNIKGLTPGGEVLVSAGKCLFYTGSQRRAVEYFDDAKKHNYEDEQSAFMTIMYYETGQDIDKQIESLEHYAEFFSSGDEIEYVREKLFDKYYEKEDYRKVFYAFNNLPLEKTDNIAVLEKYFVAAQQIGSLKKTEETAQKLYNLDPNNFTGLSFVAKKTFNEAEEEFLEAQKIYNAKKTNANLKIFKKKQEELKPRYTLAKAYYTRLYKLYKRPSDAADLAVICQRLGDKTNAEYYTKLSKKKN